MIIQLREGSFEALSPDVYVLVVKQPRLTDHWTWAGALLSKAGISGGFLARSGDGEGVRGEDR